MTGGEGERLTLKIVAEDTDRDELVAEGALAEVANIGREGKARRLLDRRFESGV